MHNHAYLSYYLDAGMESVTLGKGGLPPFVHPQLLPVDTDSGSPVNCPKVQQGPALPVGWHGECASVPHVGDTRTCLEYACRRVTPHGDKSVCGFIFNMCLYLCVYICVFIFVCLYLMGVQAR